MRGAQISNHFVILRYVVMIEKIAETKQRKSFYNAIIYNNFLECIHVTYA